MSPRLRGHLRALHRAAPPQINFAPIQTAAMRIAFYFLFLAFTLSCGSDESSGGGDASPAAGSFSTLGFSGITSIDTVTANSARVRWTHIDGAVLYLIYRVNGSEYTLVGSVSAPTNSYTATGLTPSTAYTYAVRLIDSDTLTDNNSATLEVTTSAPDDPTNTHSLVFESSNSEYVDMGDVEELSFEYNQAFSLDVRFRSTSAGDTTQGTLVSKMYQSGTNYRGYQLKNNAGVINFGLHSTFPANALNVNAGTGLNDGLWHHVIVSYDGSALASGVKIYIDNVDTALTVNYNTLSGTILDTAPFRLGSREGGAYFNGAINTVRVWNVALTPANATALYNGGTDGGDQGISGSVGEWWLGSNDDDITNIEDLSDNDNNGTPKAGMVPADIIEEIME